MMEVSLLNILAFVGTVLISTLLGVRLSTLLPWNTSLNKKNMSFAFGATLAPFICGILSIAVLTLMPGATWTSHAMVIFGIMIFLLALLQWRSKQRPDLILTSRFTVQLDALLIAYVFLGALLIFDSLTLPLTQNDALEYATIGREIFHSRTLSQYPLIDTVHSLSGFYAPWTHPPLYVAQIYFSQILQGHALFPGLMRLLTPWMLISTSILLGALTGDNKTWGRLTSLLFITIPLLFLGANSSLIDTLPIAGTSLVFAAILALEDSPRKWIFVGALIGITLWSHSQSILLLPLFLGLVVLDKAFQKKWLACISTSAIVAASSLLLGIWPYLKNFRIFGSFISDSPPVVNLSSLRWDEYFFIARGIDTTTAQIQYGLFKGWFNIASYGFIFWLSLLGMGFVLHKNRQKKISLLLASSLLILAYHGGVLLSILLGLNIMIKNDRYLLLISPFLSITAGYALYQLLEIYKRKTVFYNFCLIVLASIFTLHGLILHKYRINSFNSPFIPIEDHHALLKKRPEYEIIFALKEKSSPQSLVFTTKPADLYYSERRMLTHTDPLLIPFYEASNAEDGLLILKNLGVTHIHQPDFLLPSITHSVMLDILSNPSMSSLIASNDGHQIYELTPQSTKQIDKTVLFPIEKPWEKTVSIDFGGVKSFASLSLKKEFFTNDSQQTSSLFQKELKTTIHSPTVDIANKKAQEIYLNISLTGQGYIKIWISENNNGTEEKVLLGDLTLSGEKFVFKRRQKIYPTTESFHLVIDHFGKSSVTLQNVDAYFYEEIEK